MANSLYKNGLLQESLTVKNFSNFYRSLLRLRFPIQVASVLELRAILNDTIDKVINPKSSLNSSDFTDSINLRIEKLGIDREDHRRKLVTLLAVLRNLHFNHCIASRNDELEVRDSIKKNRKAHQNSVKYGTVSLILAIVSSIVWFELESIHWLVKAVTVLSLMITWESYRSLPVLDRDNKRLQQKLNAVYRRRVDNIDWDMVLRKVALILGYKKERGVEVFRDSETELDQFLV